MAADSLPGQMRSAATTLLAALDGPQRELAARSFTDDNARRWLEYRPRLRPGACIADMGGPARKVAHRLLATALSEHAYAQAMAIVALEEVLDRREGWRQGRHSGDYWVTVFGDPSGDEPWSWRFEGHHLSVTMTVSGAEVSPAPEEDVARALLDALGPAGRAIAVVSDRAPADIRTGTRPRAQENIEPHGIAAARLGPAPRAVLGQLVALYLGRLTDGLAVREAARVAASQLYFAWEGPTTPGQRHYYRVQGDDLLIEYDNTSSDGNHAHTVLRRPHSDFGGDVLAAHYRRAHP